MFGKSDSRILNSCMLSAQRAALYPAANGIGHLGVGINARCARLAPPPTGAANGALINPPFPSSRASPVFREKHATITRWENAWNRARQQEEGSFYFMGIVLEDDDDNTNTKPPENTKNRRRGGAERGE